MANAPGIYVEVLIRASADEIWRVSQTPDLHQLWDLRFTSIDYLPKSSENEAQRFLYSTRIGFGLRIDGEGESTGTREDGTGLRTSALRFWSSDPKSLIKEGSGYWRYVPAPNGVRFVTWYDYRTRFGAAGRLIDRVVFRSLIGWATAWSFDRLRLWVDQGVPPRISMRMALIHAVARLGIAFIWLWQGLIPKLLFANADEKAMIAGAGLPLSLLPVIGVLELLFSIATLGFWRWRTFFLLNVLVMTVALMAVALQSPSYLTAAFNPVTLNVGMVLLSIAGYLSAGELPSASRCLRRAPKGIA
ncbi:MAG TPA: DoxX-like family protein [Bryobacteraceae bacterium]|nr:DoxX-like family protein [Bryobacteraceae bacterium]